MSDGRLSSFRASALACVMLIMASCSNKPSSTAAAATTTSPTTTATAPSQPATTASLPEGIQISDLTWISATHGWALAVTAMCQLDNCNAHVITTTDGGDTWTRVDQGGPLANVNHLRFANPHVGYAFDPDFMTTNDGGVTWQREAGPHVHALETDGHTVLRLSYTGDGCPGPCGWSIDRATVGNADWQVMTKPKLRSNGVSAELVRDGRTDAYAVINGNPAGGAENASSDFAISHDGGATWTVKSDPCDTVPTEEFDTRAIAANVGVVAAVCQPRMHQDRAPSIVISTNGGAMFGPQHELPAGTTPDLIALTSSRDLVVATEASEGSGRFRHALLATHDGGGHWTDVASETTDDLANVFVNHGFLGFETSRVGRWVGDPKGVWTTTDGGAHWTVHHFN